MRKKWMALFFIMSVVCTTPVWAGQETTKTEAFLEYSYPLEDAPEEIRESTLGYSMEYDPKLFTLDDTEEGIDSFVYHTAEEVKAPVYFTVMAYPQLDARTLAEGLALQLDLEEEVIQTTCFGAESMETLSIYVEEERKEEEEELTVLRVFYAIPKEKGSLLVEIGGYAGMPHEAERAFENMPGTFQLVTIG